MVVPDHGFGGSSRKCIYLNRGLAQCGLQSRVNHRPNFFARAKQVALAGLPARLQASAFRIYGGRRASRLESRARFAEIVWERTAAFSKELGYFPSIRLKLKGRSQSEPWCAPMGGMSEAAIADLAPTLLILSGLEPPAGLDGRVLVRPCAERLSGRMDASDEKIAARPYSEAEEREIARCLADLGYLD